eukprot:126375-Hanusia_phi.AAC.2
MISRPSCRDPHAVPLPGHAAAPPARSQLSLSLYGARPGPQGLASDSGRRRGRGSGAGATAGVIPTCVSIPTAGAR